MSERVSPEALDTAFVKQTSIQDLDIELSGGKPIEPDVEQIAPPVPRQFSGRSNKPQIKKKIKPKVDQAISSDFWDPSQGNFLPPDALIESSSGNVNNSSGFSDSDECKDNVSNQSRKRSTPSELTEILMKLHSFAMIDDILHCYDYNAGYWRCIPEKDSKDALRKMIPKELRACVSASVLSEVYQWIKIDCQKINSDALFKRKDYLNFRNGTYSLKKQKKLQHKSDLYFQNVLQVDYTIRTSPYKGYYDNFINSTFGNDIETRLQFEEFLGLALSSVRDSKQAFFLYGPSNTGKSVILNVLERIIGLPFTSSLSFSQLSNEFAVAQLTGKWLNISGEMSGVANKRLDLFKSLTGNDLLTACFKGKDHFQFRNQALLVFACNNFPEISPEFVESFASRMIIFPFTNVIPKDQWIPNLSEYIFREYDIIIERALEGLLRLRKRNYEFKETIAMRQCKELFLGQANSFLVFAKKYLVADTKGQCFSRDIKNYYNSFCDQHDFIPLADNVWSKLLQETYPVQKCNITSGLDFDGKRHPYNSRGYKGIRLMPMTTAEDDLKQ